MQLKEVIHSRTTHRKFTPYKPISREIDQILEAAKLAPSWANTQVWRFVIVQNQETIRKIAKLIPLANPARKCTQDSNLVIVCCFEKNKSGRILGIKSTNIQGWGMFDLALAVENMSLQVHDMGLGSVIIGIFDRSKIRKILNIPEHFEVAVLLTVGKPEKPNKKPTKKLPIDKIAYWEKYK